MRAGFLTAIVGATRSGEQWEQVPSNHWRLSAAPQLHSGFALNLSVAFQLGGNRREPTRESIMRRQPIACALLLWYLAACTAWHVERGVTPTQLISTTHPTAVRLTLSDNAHLVLNEPRVATGDSLAGVRNGAPFSVAVSDVTQVATRKVSAGKTVGLGLGIAISVFLLFFWTAFAWDTT